MAEEKQQENQEEKDTPQNQEEQDSQNTAEEKTSENQKSSEKEQPESLESLAAQKKHWREKAQKSDEELSKLQEQLDELKEAKTEKQEDEVQENAKFTNQERDFLLTHRDVDADTFETVRRLAKAYDIGLEDAYENDEVKSFIEFRKSKSESNQKVPSPSASPAKPSTEGHDLSTKEGRQKFAEAQAAKQQAQKGRGGSADV